MILAEAYQPYGEMLYTAGSAASSYGFTGEWSENGLVYLRARYYSSGVGQFITKDPYHGDYQHPNTLNLFAYVNNNPINGTDPTGHMRDDGCRSVGCDIKPGEEWRDYVMNVVYACVDKKGNSAKAEAFLDSITELPYLVFSHPQDYFSKQLMEKSSQE